MRKIIRKIGAMISSAVLLISCVPTITANAEAEPKLLAMAFDDGPNTTTTNEVIDVLDKYNAKATFFLIGININDESAKSVKRAYDMGMEIANHSKTHNSMTRVGNCKMLEDNMCPIYLPGWFQGSVEWMYT